MAVANAARQSSCAYWLWQLRGHPVPQLPVPRTKCQVSALCLVGLIIQSMFQQPSAGVYLPQERKTSYLYFPWWHWFFEHERRKGGRQQGELVSDDIPLATSIVGRHQISLLSHAALGIMGAAVEVGGRWKTPRIPACLSLLCGPSGGKIADAGRVRVRRKWALDASGQTTWFLVVVAVVTFHAVMPWVVAEARMLGLHWL